MTRNQAQWAQQHDWYVNSFQSANGTYVVRVIERTSHADGSYTEASRVFTDFAELKAWAGY